MERNDKPVRQAEFTVKLESLYPPYRIPTEARLTVCDKINGLGGEPADFGLGERWRVLSRPIRLAGAEAMRPDRHGRLPGLAELIGVAPWSRRLVEDLDRQLRAQVALGRPWVKFDPILLIGDPGVGKTWFARRLGATLGLGFAALELGSMSDDRLLSGTARGYTSATPAWPLVVMASEKIANPVLILDELDKAGGSEAHGHAHRALLGMLEGSSAGAWYDQCLMTNCDLIQINWVACANDTASIPRALLSRFKVVEIPAHGEEDFDDLLISIIHELARCWDMPVAMLPDLPRKALEVLRDRFERRKSIRVLARDTRTLIIAALADGRRSRKH